MKHKLTVITDEQGQVVATQLGHGDSPNPDSGITFSIVAGPGQKQHKIEFDVPSLETPEALEEFHHSLAAHLSNS